MGSSATPLLEVERQNENSNRDHFSKLPEFLILRIFKNLQLNQGADIKTLLRCAQVSIYAQALFSRKTTFSRKKLKKSEFRKLSNAISRELTNRF